MVRNKLRWDANNTVGLPKQKNFYQSSPTFLCFESPTASFVSQGNLFRTMWPYPAKAVWTTNKQQSFVPFSINCNETNASWMIYVHTKIVWPTSLTVHTFHLSFEPFAWKMYNEVSCHNCFGSLQVFLSGDPVKAGTFSYLGPLCYPLFLG